MFFSFFKTFVNSNILREKKQTVSKSGSAQGLTEKISPNRQSHPERSGGHRFSSNNEILLALWEIRTTAP